MPANRDNLDQVLKAKQRLTPKPRKRSRRMPRTNPRATLTTANVATLLVLAYALVGAVLVILSAATHVDPRLALSFRDYLQQMAIAAGGLAIGRGVAARTRA